MIISKNPKRLAIYFFFDKQGILDDYVTYFLSDLQKNVTKILIVSNGEVNKRGMKCLKEYGELFIRENVGFDVWAYKESIEYIGWEELEQYDEVIMLNSTIMGPVFPLKETFDKMDKMDIDFWGITKYFKQNMDPSGCCKYGYIPDHIQSHFIACRKSLVKSPEFHKYWEEMPMIHNYWEAVGKHEMIFTKHFEDLGFKSAVSADAEELRLYSGYPLMMCPLKLIKGKRCPIFKRKMFFNNPKDFMSQTMGEQPQELYHYLEEETSYDVNYIWDTILRNYNHADIVKDMNLHYVFSERYSDKDHMKQVLQRNKVALFMHLYFEDLLEESLHYAETMPPESDIYITTTTEEMKKAIEKVFSSLKCNYLEVRVIKNRGRDVASLLVGVADVIMNYDIACFVHDKKTAQVIPGTAGAGFAFKCFQNTLASRAFVYNVIDAFDRNPRMGLLSPPEPNHGPFFTTIGKEWRECFKPVKKLAAELGVDVPISKDKYPVAPYGSTFWFRPKAMEPIYRKKWDYTDFPEEPLKIDNTISHAIERIRPFIVQEAGFYPGVVMSDRMAGIEYGNLRYYLREYNTIMMENGIEHYHQYMCGALKERLENYEDRDSLKGVLKRRFRNRVNGMKHKMLRN